MVQSKARTVAQYLAEQPADRREALEAVRRTILDNVDDGIVEGVQYGMIGYHVSHAAYPAGYHCDPKQPLPYVALASQKNHMALYLFCIYVDADDREQFAQDWRATGKKLDMGKACVRFKSLDDVPLDVLGAAIRRMPTPKFVATYEASLKGAGARKKAAKKAAKK